MLSSAANNRLKVLSLKILDLLWFINELRPLAELEKRKNTLEYYLPKAKDDHEKAETLLEIGKLECAMGRNVEAAGRFYECLRLFRKSGDRLGVGKTLYCIALLHIERGKLDKAEETLRECMQFAEECDSPWLKASSYELMARILMKKGKVSEAVDMSLKAFELFSIVGDAEGMSKSLQNACIALIKKGDVERAVELLSRIREIWRDEDECNYLLSTLQLSALLLSLGRIGEAERLANETDVKCGNERLLAFEKLIKALILASCGDKEKAVVFAEEGKRETEKLYPRKDPRYQIAGEVLNAVRYLASVL